MKETLGNLLRVSFTVCGNSARTDLCGGRWETGVPTATNILVDGGYTGEKFAGKVKELLGCKVEVAKRSELHTFKVIPKRWVVERSFAWLEKCRRLWKNYERKINTSLNMAVLAFTSLLLKRF